MKSLQLKASAFAVALAAAVSVGAQPSGGNDAPAPPPSSKQAENDCSGMTWIALDNCLRLNADNARRPSTNLVAPLRSGAHDCSGMVGAPLETCLKLNGQAESVGGRGNGYPATGAVETERVQRAQPEPGAK